MIKQAQDQHLKAHILWEYWTAENSDGYHNPELARESLAKSMDESQKGIKLINDAINPPPAATRRRHPPRRRRSSAGCHDLGPSPRRRGGGTGRVAGATMIPASAAAAARGSAATTRCARSTASAPASARRRGARLRQLLAAGRMDIVRALAGGGLPFTAGLARSADSCDLCGACDLQCHFTTGLRPVAAMQALKEHVAAERAAGRAPRPAPRTPFLAELATALSPARVTNDPADLAAYADDPGPLSAPVTAAGGRAARRPWPRRRRWSASARATACPGWRAATARASSGTCSAPGS